MKPYVVAITGASGVIYGVRLVQCLVEMGQDIILIISESARLVFREELHVELKNISSSEFIPEIFGPQAVEQIKLFQPDDFASPVASGSYPIEAMIVIPCSMGTLGAIASGMSQNLIHRAADCTIKEGRRLVLVPRETPLSSIHLENMLKLARLGVRMVPAMPAFYSGSRTVKEMVDFVVGKVLDQLGLAHELYPRWAGAQPMDNRHEDGYLV